MASCLGVAAQVDSWLTPRPSRSLTQERVSDASTAHEDMERRIPDRPKWDREKYRTREKFRKALAAREKLIRLRDEARAYIERLKVKYGY